MTTEQVMEVMKEAMLVAFEMAGPLSVPVWLYSHWIYCTIKRRRSVPE